MAWKSDFLSDLLESVNVIPKKSACGSQYLIGGEGLCVLKGLGITFLEDWFNDNVLLPNPRSTYLIHISIYIVSLHSLWQFGLHFFLFAICHHGSLHPPFTKRFRYPKCTILAVSFHHCRSLDLRHLEGLMIYSPSLVLKGWNENPVKWMRFPQWGLTLQRSFFSASWPQARCPQRSFYPFWFARDDFLPFNFHMFKEDGFVDLSYVPLKYFLQTNMVHMPICSYM